MTWAVAYEVDWRDVFTALGSVDLNSPGNTLTFDGITWTTPAVADGNPVDQEACTTWELDASGLHCVDIDNSRMDALNNGAPHLYATLPAIAANTATPFEADPSRSYLWQCFVSSLTLQGIEDEGCGVAMYRLDQGIGVGNQQMTVAALGFRGGSGPRNFAEEGQSATPGGFNTSFALDCPTIHTTCSRRQMCYAGDFAAGAFPAQPDLRSIGIARLNTAFMDNDLNFDPPTWRLAMYHNCPTFAGNAYDGVIQRVRLLQGP